MIDRINDVVEVKATLMMTENITVVMMLKLQQVLQKRLNSKCHMKIAG
jgi:hypothetical protein